MRQPRHSGVTRPARHAALAVAGILLLVLAACGNIQTAACGLVIYTDAIDTDIDTLVSLDPELAVQAGSAENATALETLDSMEASAADGQAALDNATEDQVGDRVRETFQLVLDVTTASVGNIREAIDTGDAALYADQMTDAQAVADAIDTFNAAVGDSRVDCPEPSVSAAASAGEPAPSATAEPTVEPTEEETPEPTEEETPEPTEEETPEPTATPTAQPTPTPAPTATPTPQPTAAPTATPTAEPTEEPTPTASPTQSASPTPSLSPSPSESASASPSASASASASAEPSPSPSAVPSDSDGGALWPWLVVLGGAAAGVVGFLWYRSQQEPPIDGEGGPGEPQPPVGPGEVEEIPPGAAATGAEGATPEDSIFPSADAPPEAATPPQPGPDEVAGADASDAEAAEAADVSGPSDETEPVDYGTSQGAPGPDRDPDAGSRA